MGCGGGGGGGRVQLVLKAVRFSVRLLFIVFFGGCSSTAKPQTPLMSSFGLRS